MKIKEWIALTKPRICITQLITLSFGFLLAPVAWNWYIFGITSLGTICAAAAASIFNQVIERKSDALMERTKKRLLPTKKISPKVAIIYGLILWLISTLILVNVNTVTVIISTLTVILYVGIYTPMKKISWMNTIIGAIPGALPPLGGWAAAMGSLSISAWGLFVFLFIWQLPHFYAIAWMYKDDYKKANLKMLSVIDTDGSKTAWQILWNSILLIIISIFPYKMNVLGEIYVVIAIGVGLKFLKDGWVFYKKRTVNAAQNVLKSSIIYLVIILIAIIIDISWI